MGFPELRRSGGDCCGTVKPWSLEPAACSLEPGAYDPSFGFGV